MNPTLSFSTASRLATALFSALALGHLGIIIGITLFDYAPIDYLWGGKMKTAEELLAFEILSLLIMLICLTVVLIRTQKIKLNKLLKTSRIMLWVLTFIFILNTLGNLLAESDFEKYFAIVTFLLAILNLRMALEPVSTKVR